jgi:hypothetical protein
MSQINTRLKNIAEAFRTRKGKAGAIIVGFVVMFGQGLDLYGRGETLYKVINGWPVMLQLLHSSLFQLALLVIGFGLLLWSSADVKKKPHTQTVREELSDHQARLSAVECRWNDAKVEETLRDHERRILAQAGCLQKIAALSLWMDDIAILIHQAERCHAELSEIVRRYPQSDVSRHPFSKHWGPLTGSEPTDEATRLGLMWAAYLMQHISNCYSAPSAFGRVNAGTATHQLMAHVSAWDSAGVTAQDCLLLIEKHKEELDKIRTVQAGSFADPTLSPRIAA